MRIAALTSSRADFGILTPLLHKLADDPDIDLGVIAFGSHLDDRFGRTVEEISAAGLGPDLALPPMFDGDRPADISRAIGQTTVQFSRVWESFDTDLIVALGDRYEMFAAVAAAVPFAIPIAHLHGGETTLGAIDNAFRHSITHMSTLHFASAEPYRRRIVELIGKDSARYAVNTGALSIDQLSGSHLLSLDEVRRRTGVDMSTPTVLITFHPETASAGSTSDEQFDELEAALGAIGEHHQMLVTLPNADTTGLRLRERWTSFLADAPFAYGFDSLGSVLYLSCMRYCAFMLGNTSSGYIEASWFPKAVVDVGERQTGRIVTPNILRCPVERKAIVGAAERARTLPLGDGIDIYGDGHAAERMVGEIKRWAVEDHRG